MDSFEPLPAQANQDALSANHLRRIPGSQVAVSSHARANNQLIRWRAKGFSDSHKGSQSSLTPLLADNAPPKTPKTTMSRPANSAPNNGLANPPIGSTHPSPPDQQKPATPAVGNRPSHGIRSWTQAASGRTINATAVGRDGDALLLVGPDGREYLVSLALLSKQDQDYCDSAFRATPTDDHEHPLLNSPATQALGAQLPIAQEDLQWLAQTLDCEHPSRRLDTYSSRPNGRGGSWLATQLGLAEYDATTPIAQVTMRALAPDASQSLGESLPVAISLLEVDRFHRPIVGWGRPGHTFRWNGLDWTYLSPPRGTRILDITRAGQDIIGVVTSQNLDGTHPGGAAEETRLVKLTGTTWAPLAVQVDGKPLSNVERLFGSVAGHLVGVCRDEAFRIHGVNATPIGVKHLDAFHLSFNKSLMGTMPKVAVAKDGRLHFVRVGSGVDTELLTVAADARPWPIQINGMERPNVLGIVMDDRDRAWLHVAASQAERVREIIESGKRVPANIGVFVQQGETWKRVKTAADTLPQVQVDRSLKRSSTMPWTMAPALAPFLSPRDWKTADGKHTLRAACAELDAATVTLQGPAGVTRVARDLLDPVDQRFLKQLERHREELTGTPPTIRRIFMKRTAGDNFFNEDWAAMLAAGEIFPKITQVAGPQRHTAPLDHLWIIDDLGNVAQWVVGGHQNAEPSGSSVLKPAPRLSETATRTPQAAEQLVVDNEGNVFIRSFDGGVRALAGDRWELLNQGVEHNLVARRLRVVHGRLLAVVGSPSALQRAKGAALSNLSGVLQWKANRWQPVILMNVDEAGVAWDVVAAPSSKAEPEQTSVIVSWSKNRLTMTDLDRPRRWTASQFQQLPTTPAPIRDMAVGAGMLFGRAPSASIHCLWNERAREFDLQGALWNTTQQASQSGPATALQAAPDGAIWEWRGQQLVQHRAGKSFQLPIENERPRAVQLIGDRYLALWGSHLSLHEIQE